MSSRLAGRLRRGSTDSRQDTAPTEADAAAGFAGGLDGQPRRRRRAQIAALAAVLAVAVAIALVVILGSSSPRKANEGSGVPAGDTTATVQRRTLSEHATIGGTLTYGSKLELYDRLAGTFTWLPAVGSVIGRGGTLFEVNELPIVLMYGSVPAYRALKEGVSDGVDVQELNENLIALGYDPYGEISDYEHFGAATTAAVKRWQAAEGLRETGEVELGRVVFVPGARRITEVHVGLGQDPPGGASSEEPAAKEPAGKEPATEEPAAKEPAAKEPPIKEPAAKEPPAKEPVGKEPAAKEPAEDAKEPVEETAEDAKEPVEETGSDDPGATKSPSKGSGEKPSSSGEPAAGGGMLVLTTTSTQQLVQLDVEADEQQLAHVGERAPVTLPNGERVKARITSVGTVATESSADAGGESGNATISVTLTLKRRVVHLDEAPVTVELLEESAKNVLAVPATALIATAGGGYAVEALQDRRRVELAVTPGMFADGYVQIEGAGVHEGQTVTEPSE
jgi:outer membrane biosynthesis protein TonB